MSATSDGASTETPQQSPPGVTPAESSSQTAPAELPSHTTGSRSAWRRALDRFSGLSEAGKIAVLVALIGFLGTIVAPVVTWALSNDKDSGTSTATASNRRTPVPHQDTANDVRTENSASPTASTPTPTPSPSPTNPKGATPDSTRDTTDTTVDGSGSDSESQQDKARSVCAHAAKPVNLRGAAYANPCITIAADGTLQISSSFESVSATSVREYTLWVWLADSKGKPVTTMYKACTFTFKAVGQTAYCTRDKITPPYAGKWGAAVDISTERVNHPPIWDQPQYTGAGSGSVYWSS